MLKSTKSSQNDFANRIKNLRAQRSLTASALAKSAQVSPASVWQWENNNCVPRKATIARLANTLGVSKSYLITGNADRAEPTASPSIAAFSGLEDASLEDLMRAIEAKGFIVRVETKCH